MPTDIERLRGLLAAGTAGPWRAEPSCDEDENVYWSEDLNAPAWLVATPLTNDTATWLIDHIRESDATLIAETINALPALLDEVERLREVVRDADAVRLGVREAGVKRDPKLYTRVMNYDVSRAALT